MVAHAYNSNTSETKTDELVHVMSIRPARALKADSTFKKVLNIDFRYT